MSNYDKILNGKVIVQDNALPERMYSLIKSRLYSDKFMWSVASKTAMITHNDNIDDFNNDLSFGRIIYHNFEDRYFDEDPILTALLMSAFFVAADSNKIQFNHIFRIRIGLIVNITTKRRFHYPHVDANFNNLVGLLYFSTCDAPTRIYNEEYDNNFDNSTQNETEDSLLCLKEKYNNVVTPKIDIPCIENKIVFFNGKNFHSSSIPTDSSTRIAVNINFF